LGIKPGHVVGLLDAPAEAGGLLLLACPPRSRLDGALGAGRYDHLLFWPAAPAGLAARLGLLPSPVLPARGSWAGIPQKPFARARGIAFSWEDMQAAGLQTDLVDNKIASLSDQEYATRFVIRKERRGAYT